MARGVGRTPSAVAMKFSNLASIDPVQLLRGVKGWEGAGPFLRYDAILGGFCAVCGRFFTRMARIFAGGGLEFREERLVVRDEIVLVRDARLVVRDVIARRAR